MSAVKIIAGASEHSIQAAVITWAALNARKMPELALLFAIPNGASFGGEMKTLRSGRKIPVAAIRAHRMKAEGLKPGVPDLFLPVARAGAHGLFLEMKTDTGRVNPAQAAWLAALEGQGYKVAVCRSFEEATRTLGGYLAL